MYQSASAPRSYNSLFEMRQREDTVPRTLAHATSKLERLFEDGYRGESFSQATSSPGKTSSYFFPTSYSAQASPADGRFGVYTPIAEEESAMVSLPPPPRRSNMTRRKRLVPAARDAPDTTRVAAASGLEEETIKKVPSSGSMTDGSSTSLAVHGEIQSASSFEELVVHKKRFSSDRPRIVSLLSIPSVPTPITEQSENSNASDGYYQRLPIDDREDSPPQTPVQQRREVEAVETEVVAAAPLPTSFLLPRYASLPSLAIEKLRGGYRKTAGDEPRFSSLIRKRKQSDSSKRSAGRRKLSKIREEPYGIAVSSAQRGKAHSRSCSESSSSSTIYPPSSIDLGPENRISISSSIYPDDDDDTSSYIHIAPSNEQDDDSDDSLFDDDYDHPNDILQEIQSEQVIDSDNYQLMSILSGSRVVPSTKPQSAKPPLPTTPKPIFRRRLSPNSSPESSSLVFEGYNDLPPDDLPLTTNWLPQDERADLIRKSRKLARVFGRTPGADVMAYQDCSRTPSMYAGSQRHSRTPLSVSNTNDALSYRRASAWPSPTESHFSSISSRRHSAPLSPDDISFLNASSPLYEASLTQVATRFRTDSAASQHMGESRPTDAPGLTYGMEPAHAAASSQTSFIDLSDEDVSVIITTEISAIPLSPSAQSFIENMSEEEQLEEERRRKREKLAKLHRQLGSRVPVNLVLGGEHPDANLPAPESIKGSSSEAEDSPARKAWLMRRRSSSAAFPPWSDEHERQKEDLDTKEKALNVRRAQKMEKVFGVAPPQTLYHTRHSPSPSLPAVPIPASMKHLSTPSPLISSSTPEATYFSRNTSSNTSSYEANRKKKNDRPGTAESSQALLPKGRRTSALFDDIRNDHTHRSYGATDSHRAEGSAVYNLYQNSMDSLNDIMDRDDCESLVELHNYLNGENDGDASPLDGGSFTPRPRKLSDSSTKTETDREYSSSLRRRSLPALSSCNASIISGISVDSVSTISDPKPEATDFQMRRRRAAKLTQFFGVQYRELINDVLDSLENGLEHEWKRGTLQAGEIEDLIQRLRELKIRREGLF